MYIKLILISALMLCAMACGKKQAGGQAAALPPMPNLEGELSPKDVETIMTLTQATITDIEQLMVDLKAVPADVQQAHSDEYKEMLQVSQTIYERLSYTNSDTRSLVSSVSAPSTGTDGQSASPQATPTPSAPQVSGTAMDADQQASARGLAKRTIEYRQFYDLYRKKLSTW
jgi:hypothetical protein